MFGFHGSYLRIDLGAARAERIALPPAVLRAYLGGVGLGSWLLQREAPEGVDPLAPEAPLVFAFSPLVGTPLTTSAKFAVVAKSPLTGLLCDALASSRFAIAGKALGVDAIVVVGRCREPSVWWGGAEDRLEPTALWGRSAAQVEEALAGRGAVASFGVAAENGVRFATLSHDGRHAGRGGLGAVMAAKRLKAIVVDGSLPTPLASPDAVRTLARDLAKRSQGPRTAKYRKGGTLDNLLAFERVGALPTYGFRGGVVEGLERLAVPRLRDGGGHERASCAACTIGCEHRYATGSGSLRLEYESAFALGPLCGISDPAIVLEAARRCDALGLDALSAGGTIAFAMECGERGLLDGAPAFGDGAGLLALLDDVAHRRGLGDRLAEGSRAVARTIGAEAERFAPHVKGLELPGYEPRALHTMALGLAVGTRGADHNRSGAYELDFSDRVDRLHGDDRAARLAVGTEDRAALIDSLVLCKFLRGVFDDLEDEAATLLRAVTGVDFTADELRATARRIVELRKVFNVREGWQPADDTLPARLLEEPLPAGPVAGARLERSRLAAMVRAYNRERGWSDDGLPSPGRRGDLLLDV